MSNLDDCHYMKYADDTTLILKIKDHQFERNLCDILERIKSQSSDLRSQPQAECENIQAFSCKQV